MQVIIQTKEQPTAASGSFTGVAAGCFIFREIRKKAQIWSSKSDFGNQICTKLPQILGMSILLGYKYALIKGR